MKYIIIKTRVNTDFTKFRKIFSEADSLKKTIDFFVKLENTEVNFLNYNYSELKLMSGKADFSAEISGYKFPLRIDFMQSTYKTEMCFDVFVIIYDINKSQDLSQKLKKIFSEFLESLRNKYNGNWHITDMDLSDGRLV